MNLYYTFSIVIVLVAFFAYINQRFMHLPNSIGVMIIAILVSVLLILTSRIFPDLYRDTSRLIRSMDLNKLLMGSFLSFLLFAGTMRIQIADLRQQLVPVLLFSTLSVVIATFVTGSLMYLILRWVHPGVPFLHCLLFGALISPTDPLSVLSILKQAGISKSLETKIAGESVFNDGVALIVFFTLMGITRNPGEPIGWDEMTLTLVREALGGLVTGITLGYISLKALKSIDDYSVEVMITLALVMGGYMLAGYLHISGPLTIVAAGIFIGNYGKKYAMSNRSVEYLDKFWEVIEEILNIILFSLIGFELLFISNQKNAWLIGLSGIVVVLAARFISLWLPATFINLKEKMTWKIVGFLTWGGLRGGVSIALALSLARWQHRDLFLLVTYCVVVFSIVVQGLTIEKIVQRSRKNAARTGTNSSILEE